MLPKKGKHLRIDRGSKSYAAVIACALKSQLGTSHQAAKTLMKWTGASERTVKNWLSGISGPSGEHLVELIRHSDNVLQALLAFAGRPLVMTTYNLVSVRAKLTGIVDQIDSMFQESVPRGKADGGVDN
jgi:hypothetical protein